VLGVTPVALVPWLFEPLFLRGLRHSWNAPNLECTQPCSRRLIGDLSYNRNLQMLVADIRHFRLVCFTSICVIVRVEGSLISKSQRQSTDYPNSVKVIILSQDSTPGQAMYAFSMIEKVTHWLGFQLLSWEQILLAYIFVLLGGSKVDYL
jgi:hypothetical protein